MSDPAPRAAPAAAPSEPPRAPTSGPRAGRRAGALVLVAGLLCLAGGAWGARDHLDREPPQLAQADREAAADAVRLFLTLSAHLRATGGDTRFAERLPATPEVVDELLGELAFLAARGRTEEARLVKADVREVAPSGFERAEVRTREYWITRDPRSGEPPRSDVVDAVYRVRRDAAGWRVESWDPDLAPRARPAAER